MRLIDADALAEKLGIKEDCKDCQYAYTAFCSKSSDFVNACEAIFDAPTIDQVKARWEIGTGFRWRCSKCGGLTYIPSKFCFNCGARMNGEQDG